MKTNKDLPIIRIKDAWLLRDNASQHLHKLWASDGDKLADDAWMEKKVAEYQDAWEPVGQNILTGMTSLLDLSFRQNIIDVYVAPWFYAFSDPLVIGVTLNPKQFVNVLTHELLHRLFTDNNETPAETPYEEEWYRLFGAEHSMTTLLHIPVHAAHKAIYLDILKDPVSLKEDIKNSTDPDYRAAWLYVEQHDYREIVKNLKHSYKELSEDYKD